MKVFENLSNMDVDDNFYDEITSFIPPTDDYTFNDFDEILNSTVSNFDSSFDIDTLVKNEFNINSLHSNADENGGQDSNVFSNFNFNDFQSATNSLQSSASASPTSSNSVISPYSTYRTPSTSSQDGDLFTSDDFMKFLNDDDMKLEEFSPLTLMDEGMPQRNTPSPTGSCSSSGGSSTSGVQSDASSIVDTKPIFNGQDVESGMIMMSPAESSSPASTAAAVSNVLETTHFMHVDDEKMPKAIQTSKAAAATTMTSNASFVPINGTVVPLPIATTPASTTTEVIKPKTLVRPVQQVAPINILPGTIIPIQNIPLTTITPATTTTAVPIKIETKIQTKSQTPHTPQPIKIVTTPAPAPVTGAAAAPQITATKVTPPTNSKPKTIFLSANDFKALMQKVNTDGKSSSSKPTVSTTTATFKGQMPKIIMKAPNGKVITSKVATPVAIANPPTPKIIKTTNATAGAGLLPTKQHAQKFVSTSSRAAAINILKLNAAGNSPGMTANACPDLSMYKGIMDEKMLKKQQRMIKNRESASLSRKKKKEYVISLETRISNLEKENSSLKGENTSLRSQLVAFAQSCHCKNGNARDFVLNSLNIKLNGDHQQSQQHVRIAPKPTNKSGRQKMSSSDVRKNVAVLFAMAFMVTMNVGNFQNYLNKNSLENAIMENGEELLASTVTGNTNAMATSGPGSANGNSNGGIGGGTARRLLWVPTEMEFNNQLNQTKREAEMDAPPPLHFLKPINRNNGSRRQEQEQLLNQAKVDEPPLLLQPKCNSTTPHNQTDEYLRLATNLHKWIDGNDYLNLSMPYDKYKPYDDDYAMDTKTDVKLNSDGLDFKLPEELFDEKPLILPGAKAKRKIYMDADLGFEDIKHRKLDYEYVERKPQSEEEELDDKKSLDLFKPKISDEYVRLFKGIKRQDDTFYVLSFNMEHILLPASAYNKSSRPKMSLMLPSGDPAGNGDIVLMQIDCEVINTTELALKSDMIPEKLRPQKYSNSTATNTAANPTPTVKAAGSHLPRATELVNNETGSMGPALHLNETKLNLMKATHNSNNLMPKEKPTVRTYVLVGPKTQEAAAAARKQPTIVRISPNDSRFLNVKSSSLIAKMRETHAEELEGDVVV